MDAECLRITRPDKSPGAGQLQETGLPLLAMWYFASRHTQV
jgi:hypothetical protein